MGIKMNQNQIDYLENTDESFTGDLEAFYQAKQEYEEWLDKLPLDDKLKYYEGVDASTD